MKQLKKLSIYALFSSSVMIAQNPGTLDITYGMGGKISSNSNGRALEMRKSSTGEIFIVGSNGTSTTFPIVEKYLQNGTPDVSFGINGVATFTVPGASTANLYDIEITSNGEIVVAGNLLNTDAVPDVDVFSARLLPNGNLDATYGTNGITVLHLTEESERIFNGELQTDGKLLCFGPGANTNNNNRLDIMMIRFNTNGTLDNTFGTNGVAYHNTGGINNFNYASAIQNDGKIVLTGFKEDAGINLRKSYVARFNTDGSIDNTFGINGFTLPTYNGSSYTPTYAATIQPDGKILIGGGIYTSTSSNATYYDLMIARFDASGTLDPTFGNSGYIMVDRDSSADMVYDIIVENNKIITCGVSGYKLNGNTYNSNTYDMAVGRFDMNGAIDNSFGNNGFTVVDFDNKFDQAYGIVYDPTINKLISCGFKTDLSSLERFTLIRLNYDNTITNLNNNHKTKNTPFNIYPNPNKGDFILDFNALTTGSYSIKINNALGQLVYEDYIIISDINKIEKINLTNHITKGIYNVGLVSLENAFFKKIIID